MGVKSASDLAVVMKRNPGLGRLMVGHVFGSSMHHYLLREMAGLRRHRSGS